MPKVVNTILYGDDVESSKEVSISGCICKLFDLRRGEESNLLNDAELHSPALYILLNRGARKAYIGQTTDFIQRLAQHTAQRQFWDEVLSFHATDSSLGLDQIHYLEAKTYELVSNANNYDLSENGQRPSEPTLGVAARIQVTEFMKHVQFLTKFVGCDIFEHRAKSAPMPSELQPLFHFQPVEFIEGKLSGRVKLSLGDGVGLTKGKFVNEVVKVVMKNYPKATFAQLQATFPVSLLGVRWGGWGLLQDDLDLTEQNITRFNREILESHDGIRFRVCNQWDQHNIVTILGAVKSMGLNYQVISD